MAVGRAICCIRVEFRGEPAYSSALALLMLPDGTQSAVRILLLIRLCWIGGCVSFCRVGLGLVGHPKRLEEASASVFDGLLVFFSPADGSAARQVACSGLVQYRLRAVTDP